MNQVAAARAAIFGGTFDPVHNTHLSIARSAADAFGLRRVLFTPAGNPPFKVASQAPWSDRMRMLELALADCGDSRFECCGIEEPNAAGEPSYSIRTVERLTAEGIGPLSFIIGADALADLMKWHRAEDLIRAVEFIVVPRPGSQWAVPPGAVVRDLPLPLSPVSSSGVRQRLHDGAAAIPVPEPVKAYIREHSLYGVNLSHKS